MVNKKNNTDIPFHYYNEAAENVQCEQGEPLLSLDPQFPFTITQFEIMNASAQADYPHRHDCYEVLYICGGEGAHIIDFEPHPIQSPVFYFLSKDQVHFWQLEKPLKGYALLFPEEFLGFPSQSVIRAQDLAFFQQAVQDYANMIGISSSHLTDTVKAVTGFTPGQLIRQKLALEAKRLLVHSNATVAEIGYRLNFYDASYFGRFFKREVGMSPAAFRQLTREKYQ